jgi:hypothetical protein
MFVSPSGHFSFFGKSGPVLQADFTHQTEQGVALQKILLTPLCPIVKKFSLEWEHTLKEITKGG